MKHWMPSMNDVPLYKALAQKVAWQPPAGKFKDQRDAEIKALVRMLPSGSGWDLGTKIDLDKSSGQKLVLFGEFHHMNDGGFYDGWTDHSIIVTPCLQNGFDLRVTGRDRNDIKDYLHELFHWALSQKVDSWPLPASEYGIERQCEWCFVPERLGETDQGIQTIDLVLGEGTKQVMLCAKCRVK